MAINDAAVLKPSGGNFYTAPVGTALPTNLKAPDAAWVNVGHTSIDSILAFASEGGDVTTLGTLQAPSLIQSIAPRTESFGFVLEQWDEAGLKMYFGSNMVDVNSDGSLLGVPSEPAPTEAAFLAVISDGTNAFGIYAPKASLFRGDDASIDDTASLAGLPINVTPLAYNGNTWPYALTPMASNESSSSAA
jgi:hypothetical protein